MDTKELLIQELEQVPESVLETAHQEIILYKAGQLKLEKVNEVIAKIVELLQSP